MQLVTTALTTVFTTALATVIATTLATTTIYGGIRAASGEYPYVVALLSSLPHQFCGGTIIGPTTILTAAHCALRHWPIDVVFGITDLRTRSTGSTRRVARVIPHPAYSPDNLGYDVAILKLAHPICTGPDCARARISPHLTTKPGVTYTTLGWGLVMNGQGTSHLLKAPGTDAGTGTCSYDSRVICVTSYRSVCPGDSGGPLLFNGTQVGITSFATSGDCGAEGQYSGFVSTAAHYDFIVAASPAARTAVLWAAVLWAAVLWAAAF